jgi:uncharacterized membrane protein YuzA (DUF378 family)
VRIATILIQNLIRLLGVVLIVLGILFWTGHSFQLVPLHTRLGETLAALLIILAILGIVSRLNPGLTIGAIVWGLLVVFFGMNMARMLPGPAHEVIRVLHFLIGLGAIALAESLGVRIRRISSSSRA